MNNNKLQLYLPVKPFYINQPFGAVYNLKYYKDNGIAIIGHNGTDLMAKHGQPVFAAHEGLAYFEEDDKQGFGVIICSEKQYQYVGDSVAFVKSIYWHFTPDYKIPWGTRVRAGDFIGWADSSGLSTGDHLHWAIKWQNPATDPFDRNNIEQNNGYLGASDPMPYSNALFAQDLNTKYEFLHTISYGEMNPEVVMLQIKLNLLGFLQVNPTGFYGTLTKAAVFAFQEKYVAKEWWSNLQVAANRGNSVGYLTRNALNQM